MEEEKSDKEPFTPDVRVCSSLLKEIRKHKEDLSTTKETAGLAESVLDGTQQLAARSAYEAALEALETSTRKAWREAAHQEARQMTMLVQAAGLREQVMRITTLEEFKRALVLEMQSREKETQSLQEDLARANAALAAAEFQRLTPKPESTSPASPSRRASQWFRRRMSSHVASRDE